MPLASCPTEVLFSLSATGTPFFMGIYQLLTRKSNSVASSDIATLAMRHGARMITHLFNAMPQLHHRDPTIIGLLGASPHFSPVSPVPPVPPVPPYPITPLASGLPPNTSNPNAGVTIPANQAGHAEAIDTTDTDTPPQTPFYPSSSGVGMPLLLPTRKGSKTELHLEKGEVADMAFVRPFYGMIVDGIHSHPNSVLVSLTLLTLNEDFQLIPMSVAQLAYSAHPEGCILVTDGEHGGIKSYDLFSRVT